MVLPVCSVIRGRIRANQGSTNGGMDDCRARGLVRPFALYVAGMEWRMVVGAAPAAPRTSRACGIDWSVEQQVAKGPGCFGHCRFPLDCSEPHILFQPLLCGVDGAGIFRSGFAVAANQIPVAECMARRLQTN